MTRALALLLASMAAVASAQDALDDWSAVPVYHPSPENFALELRAGQHFPNLGQAFDDFFGGDLGPVLGFELDYFPLRIPYVGMVGVGLGGGWVSWEGRTREVGTTVQTEEVNSLELYPLYATLVLRVDVLPRELDVPVVLTGKIGPDVNIWRSAPGFGTEASSSGVTAGLRFAGQLAIELDFLGRRDARRLDDEWGINHTEIFAEINYSMAGEIGDGLPVGGLGWAAGLGLTF
jgi:hypothetical protein